MKRLLIVTTVPATLRAFLLPFSRYFRKQGWQVDAMASGISNCQECQGNFDRLWEVKWSRNPLDPRNLINAPSQIRAAIKEGGYDLVHVHTPVAAFVTRFALRDLCKAGRVKVIYTAHGFHFYKGGSKLKNAVFLTLEKMAGKWTDRLVVINQEDHEAVLEHRLVPAERLTFMPGIGVDIKMYENSACSEEEPLLLRQNLDIAPGVQLFLMVAEFIPRKRHSDVLKAFAGLGNREACLLLAGTGPLESDMKDLAQSLGIAERVRFLGFRRDIHLLIQSSISTILPSSQEGLPRCVMESMCLSVPVIGSAIRGTCDLLNGDCGLLVPVRDVEALTNAMAWVMEHPEEACAIGERGRSRITDYDLQRILKMHKTMYSEALGNSHALSESIH